MHYKKCVKLTLDTAMYMLFIILSGQHLTSAYVHEWLGLTALVFVLLHSIMNYRWYISLFKGKYTILRTLRDFVNILLVIFLTACFAGSLMVSGVVFKAVRIPNVMLGRHLHMVGSAWCFVLMSIHMGIHIRVPKSPAPKAIFYAIGLFVSAYGVYQFFVRRFYEELFLIVEFKWFDYQQSIIFYLLKTVCLSVAFAMISILVKRCIIFVKEHKYAKDN